MKNIPMAVLAAFLVVLGDSPGLAEQDQHHHGSSQTIQHGIRLSKELKGILSEEMLAIQAGMKELVPAVAGGDWGRIGEIARRVDESYIMKQRLTGEQIEELHQNLPPAFQALDHGFHTTAGRLAKAAEQRDGQLVTFYTYKLSESCVECHAAFASERFPGFRSKPDEHHHEH